MSRESSLRLTGRILYLTDDPELIRKQLAGEDLPFDPDRKLVDNISTDEITPGWVCYYYDETLGRFSYSGLRGGLFAQKDTLKNGGFEVIVSGLSKGCGSSRETAPYSELVAGAKLRGARFEASKLAVPRGPADLTSAVLQAVATDGKPVRLRIDSIAPAPDPEPQTPVNEAAGLTVYTLSFRNGAGNAGEFAPLCNGGPALALPGRWDYFRGRRGDGRRLGTDPTDITFSCADAALGKCVLMGYRPWAKGDHLPLDELHAACVRAVRADYCGTGDSATVAGTLINIYDSANVQRDTTQWTPEATWGPAGARCVQSPRLATLPDDAKTSVITWIGRTCPAIMKEVCAVERAPARPTIWTEHK